MYTVHTTFVSALMYAPSKSVASLIAKYNKPSCNDMKNSKSRARSECRINNDKGP